jgi:hypothetical protein
LALIAEGLIDVDFGGFDEIGLNKVERTLGVKPAGDLAGDAAGWEYGDDVRSVIVDFGCGFHGFLQRMSD